jgi:hypothetical protein
MANVIIDTSAWIQFFRYGSDEVSAVIATVAHRRGLSVLTTDPHFKNFKVKRVGPSE